MNNVSKVLLAMALATGCAAAEPEAPFAAVARTSKHNARWVRDAEARLEENTRVRDLLKAPLNRTRAVDIALGNNRELQAVFDEIGLAFSDVREARMLANPQASLEVKLPDRPPSGPLYEWDVAQNFLNLLMIPLRTRVARDQLVAAQWRASSEVTKLVSDVEIAFVTLQADAAIRASLQKAHEGRVASLQLMQKLQQAGNVPDVELEREQNAYDEDRLQMAVAEADCREHREKLNRLLGLWGAETNWTIAGELPTPPDSPPSVTGLETVAVKNRGDLLAARTQLAGLLRAYGLERSFRFFGGLDFGLAGETDPDKTNLTGPSVHLEIPIFNQGQARLARGEAQLQMAQNRFEQLAIDIRSEVREKRDRMISKLDVARFYRDELIPTRRRIAESTLNQYNAMTIGAFDAFAAQRDQIAAERGQIEATRDFWIARAELERAVGGQLPESKTP